MKYVGEAMADLNQASAVEGNVRAPLIGIATHNVVRGREELIEPNSGHEVRYPHTTGEKGKMSTALDYNHTHFWLVDDGSGKEKFGVEIKLRNQFEEALSRSQYKSEDGRPAAGRSNDTSL